MNAAVKLKIKILNIMLLKFVLGFLKLYFIVNLKLEHILNTYTNSLKYLTFLSILKLHFLIQVSFFETL